MKEIHLESASGRNSRVTLKRVPSQQPKLTLRTVRGQAVSSTRIATGASGNNLLESSALVLSDPEINLHNIGEILTNTSRAFTKQGTLEIEGGFSLFDTTTNPQGDIVEKKPYTHRHANINDINALKLGKRFPLRQALTQFVFCRQYALEHDDGLKYEFLHQLAKDLHDKQELALLGAGAKGIQPLVMQENGSPYRAFLFGEVAGEKYRLLLLLTNQELKMPKESEKLKIRTNQAEVLDM